MAKVLIYDIENSPLLAWVWEMWQTNVIKLVKPPPEEWHILCFGYKWLGERSVHSVAMPDFEGYDPEHPDDFGVVSELHRLFDEADVVVAHNGNSFDQRKAQARMLIHGMDPPSDFHSVDTLKVARSKFHLPHYRLDDLAGYLGVEGKLPTGGFELWQGCMRGDPSSWAKMTRYCRQDVKVLEQVYLRLRGWMSRHPATNLASAEFDHCPVCNADAKCLVSKGFRYYKVTKKHRYQCTNCGSNVVGRKAEPLPVTYTK